MPRPGPDPSIADDMSALFAGVAVTRRPRPDGSGTEEQQAGQRRRSGWLVATAPVVAGLLALGFYARQSVSMPQPPPAPASVRPAPVSQASLPDAPGPAPVPPSGARTLPAPPLPSIADGARPMRLAERRTAATPRPLGRAEGPHRDAIAARDPAPAGASVAASPGAFQMGDIAIPRCRPGDDRDDCIYADVMAADRRLRAAYDGAAGAGAPPRLLAAINRRWRQARLLTDEAPDEAIRRYRALARELDDLRGQQP